MADLNKFTVCVVCSPGMAKKYTKYLTPYRFSKIEIATDVDRALGLARSSESMSFFITQDYLDSLEDWGNLSKVMQQAQSMGIAVIALLDPKAQSIVLARAFDYGFDEVLCLDSPNHEFAARIRHSINEVSYKAKIGEREGIDLLTGLMKECMLSNHLLASTAYARRHNESLYATMYRFGCINGHRSKLTLAQKNRIIQEMASILCSVCRPYDAAFSLSRIKFLVIWSSIAEQHIAAASIRLADQLAKKLGTGVKDATIGVDIYKIPTDSTCQFEELKPFDSAAISAGAHTMNLR